MGDQKGEQILSACESGWNNIVTMECRLGRESGQPRGLHQEMLEDWRFGQGHKENHGMREEGREGCGKRQKGFRG